MKNIVWILIIWFPILSFSQENVEWITHFGGTSPSYGVDLGRKIAADKEGNLYVLGDFAQKFEVNGNALVSNGNKDLFLAKLNSRGKVLWIQNFGGNEADWSGDICIDDSSNIFITGTFRGVLTIGDSVYTSPSWYDIFIAKINKDGALIWSKAFIGEGSNTTSSITTDNNGHIYITGHYIEDLIFGSFQLEGPSFRSDLFVVKLNSNGDVIWAKSTKSNANNYGKSITSDTKGHLYITGFMWDSVYFDDHLLISSGEMQAYIAKIDAFTGEFIWAIGGGGYDAGWSEGNSIVVDNENNIIITGWYREVLFFGNDSVSNGGNNIGPDDIFIAKFDSIGSLMWIKTVESNLYSNAYDLTLNTENDIFLTGKFRGILKVENSIYQSTVPDYFDICVLKYDKNGNFGWLKSFGGNSPKNDIGYGITCYNNELFCTGMFSANSWFDNTHLNSNGASDIFVVKLTNSITSSLSTKRLNHEITAYPNPCTHNLYVRFNSPNQIQYQLIIYNSIGTEMSRIDVLDSEIANIDLEQFSAGTYILRIIDLDKSSTLDKKIIKIN